MEGITCPPRSSAPPARVLNAFRLHGGNHLHALCPWKPSLCAQRLSASWRESPWNHCPPPTVSQVLNAFRLHGGNHVGGFTAANSRYMCSTPFGFMEGITRSTS